MSFVYFPVQKKNSRRRYPFLGIPTNQELMLLLPRRYRISFASYLNCWDAFIFILFM